MPQCSWKALTQENVLPPYKIHGNSKNPKLSCVADFKRKSQSFCMFHTSNGGREVKKNKVKSSL